ncbi:MAG TPA: hypothetical protein VFW98_01345 [Gemmatimonadaceae bacterium]|nr:hypothetical protein [Gemmatimonadaceae bacterium]
MTGRRVAGATLAGFAGGLAVGLIVWSQQTHRSRRNLFSPHQLRRLAALGYLRGQRSGHTVRLLRDYVQWEQTPRLRRRGELILRRMEHSLE